MLTQQDLNPMRCATPGCDCDGTLVLSPRCHPRAGVKALYHKDGFIQLSCNHCGQLIENIEVAYGDQVPPVFREDTSSVITDLLQAYDQFGERPDDDVVVKARELLNVLAP